MTTSTLYDVTRIAALPGSGAGIVSQLRLEAVPMVPIDPELQHRHEVAVKQLGRRARVLQAAQRALDHALTMLEGARP